jgi:ribosomal subunit interface protein
MMLPLQITVRNVSLSEAAEDNIRTRAARLDRYFDRIMSCRVVVEAPHRHHRKGLRYNVRIDMTVPGEELVIKREPHEDLYVAIRDAFDAAKRQLESYVRRLRREVKTHETPPNALVSKLFPEEGYGFLETPDGREIYFHRNSVLNGGFDRIKVGTRVRFVEEQGVQGPQASTVEIIRKPRSRRTEKALD